MLSAFLASLALLSGNAVGNGVPADVPRLGGGAAIAWTTAGELASDPHFVSTALDARGCSRLLNGNVSGDGNAMVFGPWGAGRRRATFTVDLKAQYLVRRVSLWSAEEKGVRGCESFAVALSRDGTNFTELARHVNPSDYAAGAGGRTFTCSPLACELERPAVARFVRVAAVQHPGRHQMVLGEVAVWGEPPPVGSDVEELSPENARPTVALAVDGWGSGAATFDWRDFATADDVVAWRVYVCDHAFTDIRDAGVARLAELPKDRRTYVAHPLRPGVTRHYAVAAVYPTGECPRVRSVAHAPLGPLEVRRFRDMLGFNFFWGGGGANSGTKAYYDVAADFLVDLGIRRIRWWQAPEWAVRDQYLPRGIELCNWTNERDVCRRYGLYLHDVGNEPELTPRTPAECAELHRRVRADWRDMGPDHCFYGPVVNICTRGFDYLKGFVEAGGAAYVDAIDLHTYCAGTAEFTYPAGYPKGAPEAIFGRVEAIRAYLKSKGVERPLTCSEWGYSDTRTANPHMEDPTPLRKAQFLVRGCLVHHALGFRRLYMYSFYDEGYDADYSEHLFGVVTRDCQKKPAYHALRTLVRTVGDMHVRGAVAGLGDGDFGYVFRNVDGPGCATVVWNGARERRGVFRTRAKSVRVVSLFGETRAVKPKADGTFRAAFGPSVVYFVAAEPVEAVRTEDRPAGPSAAGTRPSVAAREAVATFVSGERAEIAFSIVNPSADVQPVQLTLRNHRGDVLCERTDTVAAGAAKTVAFSADMRGCALEEFRLTVDFDQEGESFSETAGVWARELKRTEAAVAEEVRFANLDHPVVRISSAALEVTVDPKQGGQVLDLVDKRTRRGQVTVDYAKLPVLASVPFAYGIWDAVRPGFGRRTEFSAEAVSNGVRLAAARDGRTFTKTITLDGERMTWTAELANRGPDPVSCSWRIHPEYTPHGAADSYQDYALFPTAKGAYRLVFWSGLGERLLDDVTEGWWRMVDPKAGYEIRQDYDLAAFERPKLWFGVGAWNVELATRTKELKPGDALSASLAWRFGAEEK